MAVYLHPLTTSPTPSEPPIILKNNRWILITDPKPQLDELHVMSKENHDITPPKKKKPTTNNKDSETLQQQHSWMDAWSNDYWGRPLNSPSSHKSWRPISVWSFRFIKGGRYWGRWAVGWVGRLFGVLGNAVERLLGRGRGGGDNGLLFQGSSSSSGSGREVLANELFIHRFVNVLIHAAIVQIIGAVSMLLFQSSSCDDDDDNNKNNCLLQQTTKIITQLLFALHPVHVEAVANVANRPHILALLFNSAIIDPQFPLVGVTMLAMMGLLSAETALFQFPAVVLTMTAIRYRELVLLSRQQRATKQQHKTEEEDDEESEQSATPILVQTINSLIPRYTLLIFLATLYLFFRSYNDTLSIPTGLIRPAENPFYDKLDKHQWSIWRRIMNYSYILSLHVMKAFGVEIVGFSHEYGFDCIPELQPLIRVDGGSVRMLDLRLLLPVALVAVFGGICIWCWYGSWKIPSSKQEQCNRQMKQYNEDRIQRVLLLLVFSAWMATLFPISGIIKVGTFVADRLVVARGDDKEKAKKGHDNAANNGNRDNQLTTGFKVAFLFLLCTTHLAKHTHRRTADWMDSVSLLESSLRTCPRSIKSNLEMSKLYSGLVPHMSDLERARSLIKTAQTIDPTYCDVYQQHAHVYFQEQKYLLFEEHSVEALLCPFTMGQAMTNWNKYWKVVLSANGGGSSKNREASTKRYTQYMERIEKEIAKAAKEDERKKAQDSSGGYVVDEL
ncbi:predicted protein [Thalassiosira pseudonana CCMP1335]|uniref:DUF1736 domain-containing protein n=1 Tax=Thalassiosira pseudonana TaxID=35128 RepID=B8CAU2_THAPS|nr:predicted protein [Thalassiosira pseudonana CCMP1335]EED89741.1 predicted protein [Thalassiosira pseudonana CCMP1335]